MEITTLSVKEDVVSCHYCDKGELRENGFGLQYPYDKVIRVKGNRIETNFCEECFHGFKEMGTQMFVQSLQK